VVVEGSVLMTKRSQTKFDKFAVAVKDRNVEIRKLQNSQILRKRAALYFRSKRVIVNALLKLKL
jgi:hypothetical protein